MLCKYTIDLLKNTVATKKVSTSREVLAILAEVPKASKSSSSVEAFHSYLGHIFTYFETILKN